MLLLWIFNETSLIHGTKKILKMYKVNPIFCYICLIAPVLFALVLFCVPMKSSDRILLSDILYLDIKWILWLATWTKLLRQI